MLSAILTSRPDVDVNIVLEQVLSPLHNAATFGAWQEAEVLLRHKNIDVNVEGKQRVTPLDGAVCVLLVRAGTYPSYMVHGIVNTVKSLLLRSFQKSNVLEGFKGQLSTRRKDLKMNLSSRMFAAAVAGDTRAFRRHLNSPDFFPAGEELVRQGLCVPRYHYTQVPLLHALVAARKPR